MSNKTAQGLVAYAKAQLGKPYWYGTFGQTSTKALYSSKKKQYPSQYQWSCPSNQLGVKVHDCIGLIKGYLWSDTITSTPKYNASQDVSADGMLAKCKKKGKISTIPEVAGILVFMKGHIGVYIGNGYVIEAKGHAYGVVKTTLKGRGWTDWGYCPWITYENRGTTSNPTTSNSQPINSFKSFTGYVKVNTSLNVRKGAGTQYKILGSLKNGTSVKVVGESGSWYKINYNSGYGYVSKAYITTTKPSSTSTSTFKPYTVKVTAKSGLNIRKSASTLSKKVGCLSYGTKVVISKVSGKWGYISNKGWICLTYTSKV